MNDSVTTPSLMAEAEQIKPREKMKTVLMVWKGRQSLDQAAKHHKVTQAVITNWCRIAMRGAKKELKNG